MDGASRRRIWAFRSRLIAEAVYARCISALKDERVKPREKLKGPKPDASKATRQEFIEDIRQALYASKIISYAQGYMLMRAAAKEYKWNLNYGGIALMWRGGCIIRSRFLGKIKEALRQESEAHESACWIRSSEKAIKDSQRSWRNVVAAAAKKGIPVPAFSTALAFYRRIRTAAHDCRRTCSRRSAIISARTPTSAWTNRAANSSTPIGPATAGTTARALTRHDQEPLK